MRYAFLFALLFPLLCYSQLQVKGKVLNATDKRTIAEATVFLNNTTIATKTDNGGSFTLNNVRAGHYELVVSVVGFGRYSKTVTINADTLIGDLEIRPIIIPLKEVRIGRDADWNKKIKEFKEQFLGTSEFAKQCFILNPEVLLLKYNKAKTTLTGASDDFLEIKNNALGYKIKYLLSNFVMDKAAEKVTYEGSVLFEEIYGTTQQKQLWEKYRRVVYFGSSTHFLREVLAGRADSGYSVQWVRNDHTSDRTEHILRDTLTTANYIHPTDQRGMFALGYQHDLTIYYFSPYHLPQLKGKRHGGLVAVVKFIEPYLYFDLKGTILNPLGAFLSGVWGNNRIAELLPVDYWPVEKN